MLVLIHGLAGSPAEMGPLLKHFRRTETFAPTLLAHGGRPFPAQAGFEELFSDLVEQLDAAEIGPAFFLGYSLGGYLALTLASRFPGRVRGVVALASKFSFDDNAVGHVRHLLSEERIFRGGEERREQLDRQWGGEALVQMLQSAVGVYELLHLDPPLSEEALRSIDVPVFLVTGEQDPLASGSEMRQLARTLPNARTGIFPGRAHPLENVPLPRFAREVEHFIRDVSDGRPIARTEAAMTDSLVAGGLGGDHHAFISKDRRGDG